MNRKQYDVEHDLGTLKMCDASTGTVGVVVSCRLL